MKSSEYMIILLALMFSSVRVILAVEEGEGPAQNPVEVNQKQDLSKDKALRVVPVRSGRYRKTKWISEPKFKRIHSKTIVKLLRDPKNGITSHAAAKEKADLKMNKMRQKQNGKCQKESANCHENLMKSLIRLKGVQDRIQSSSQS